MASYSATMITTGLTGAPMAASGSFRNICIDGRISFSAAVDVARDTFKREAGLTSDHYQGFAIEKTDRFVEYKNPVIVDSDLKAKDIAYLL